MKVLKVGDSGQQPAVAPIFMGTVQSRPLVGADAGAKTTVNMVHFINGGRTNRNTHSEDQILYITDGNGIVATDEHEHHVPAGDIAHIPAGEIHWHGAEPGKDMAHLSILPPGSKNEVLD